jgi:hypothetical protein
MRCEGDGVELAKRVRDGDEVVWVRLPAGEVFEDEPIALRSAQSR